MTHLNRQLMIREVVNIIYIICRNCKIMWHKDLYLKKKDKGKHCEVPEEEIVAYQFEKTLKT